MRKPTGLPEPSDGKEPVEEHQFIFHSTDKKGHHATLPKMAVPAELMQCMNQIITKGKFPYRVINDIARCGLFHEIAWCLEHMDDGYGDMLQRVRAIDEILAEEESRLKFEKQIQDILSIVSSVSDSAEKQKDIVNNVMEQVRNMPAGYWKERYLKSIRSQFGNLISGWDAGKRAK